MLDQFHQNNDNLKSYKNRAGVGLQVNAANKLSIHIF